MDSASMPNVLLLTIFALLYFVECCFMFFRDNKPTIDSIPSPAGRNIGVGMEVEPINADMDRWEWRAFFTFDGHRSPITYTECIPHHPSQFEVSGRTDDEGTAWDCAREAADDARARYAAEQVRIGRKSSDHVPL